MHQPKVANSAEDGVLEPANSGDLRGCCKAIGNVCKFEFTGRRDVTWESEELLDDVSSACQHGDTSMLNLHNTAAVEFPRISVA
eukprot:Skav204669  [mRNA]  locus=scaffold607:136955:144370:+ [translate_table: standard]